MSTTPTLIIGNKNYSSWSLRAWLLLRQFEIAFNEVKLTLDTPEFHARIGEYSAAGRVPVLLDGDLHVWDSLAIAEYANERFLDGRGWPQSRADRAHARAISAEMHSGFTALRRELPMNCRKRVRADSIGAGVMSADAARDVARVQAIWREARSQHADAGAFLFGAFGIADAMYAPVVLRFISYDVALGPPERAYVDAVAALPALQHWIADAATEALSPEHEQMTP
jgi:glutathione S-transferase